MKNKFMLLIVIFTLPLESKAAEIQGKPPIIDVSHQWEVTNIHGPSQVGISDTIAVDLNGDGWIDVVSIGIDDGSIRAYFNHGQAVSDSDLNYQQQIIDKDEVGLYRIISADLNGDGKQDLVTTNIETQQIISYTQQNDSSFIKAEVASEILLPTDVVAGDLNQDGYMDLISLSFENNEVYQHLQQAGGTYITSTIAKDILKPRKLAITDLNQSGFLDFAVVSEEDNSVRVFFNKEGLGWAEQLLTQSATGTRNLTHCDIDNNGWQDLVVSHSGDNELVLYKNFGAWPFTTQVIDNNALGINAILCQDLNNDGQKDIAAIHAQVGNIYSYLQNQNFTPELVANTRDGYITLAAADFNHTQQPQILTQAHFQQRNLLYHPTVLNAEKIIWQDFPDGAESVRVGDINGDGIDDIVLGSFRDDTVQWYDGESFKRHVIDDDVDGVNEILVVDLDEDGYVDVLSAASYANAFYWHRSLGLSGFETITIFDNARFANALEVADLDNDGDLDVIGTSGSDDSVRWFENEGKIFDVHFISNEYRAPSDVKVVDYNLDGWKDLVVANHFSGNVVHYQSNDLAFNGVVIANNVSGANKLFLDENKKSILITAKWDESIIKIDHIKGTFDSTTLNLPHFVWTELSNNGLDDYVVGSNEGIFRYNLNTNDLYKIFENDSNSIVSVDRVLLLSASMVNNYLVMLKVKDTIFGDSFEAQKIKLINLYSVMINL